LLIGVHGLIDAVYWREPAQKPHQGSVGLFGEHLLRVDGAGGRNRTTRTMEFSIPLAA